MPVGIEARFATAAGDVGPVLSRAFARFAAIWRSVAMAHFGALVPISGELGGGLVPCSITFLAFSALRFRLS